MELNSWLEIIERAYREGNAIDLLSDEKVKVNLRFTPKKRIFLTKNLNNNIFNKIDDEYERIACKVGAISLLQYHLGNRPIFSKNQANHIMETWSVMQGYFWEQVNNKKTFGPLKRISEPFGLGKSIQERYSISGGPFFSFAKTYWTFRVEVLDLLENYITTPLAQILIQIEASVASHFFPRIEPVKPDFNDIFESQRIILEKYTNKIDVNKFLAESPVLKELEKKDSCFIASATFKDPKCIEVQTLRKWRDDYLLMSRIGELFVVVYNTVSPGISAMIYKYNWLRKLSRKLLQVIIAHIRKNSS